jgi:hypothetical protein
MVQELIDQIVQKTGVPADKAQQVLGVVAGFVKEKFPMMGGQIDSLLGTSGGQASGNNKGDGSGFMGEIGRKMGF